MNVKWKTILDHRMKNHTFSWDSLLLLASVLYIFYGFPDAINSPPARDFQDFPRVLLLFRVGSFRWQIHIMWSMASMMHKLICSQGGGVWGRRMKLKETTNNLQRLSNIPCNFFIEVSKSREPFSMSLWKENINKTDMTVIHRETNFRNK